MDAIQTFFQSIAASIGPFVPRVLAAIAIAVIAWLIAKAVKAGVIALGTRTDLDAKLRSSGITATFANVAYWLVWLLALPMLLSTLGLTGLLDPVNAMLNRMLGFLPNLIGAAAVLGIGFLVARIVRQVVTGLLTAAGSEKLAVRLGMSASLGKDGLAGLVGLLVFVLIMLPVVAGALQPLGLDAVTRPVSNMLDTITALIPKLAAAAIILLFAVIVGRIVANLVATVLLGIGFDTLPSRLGFARDMRLAGRKPSELAGTLVLAGIVIAALTQASEVLGVSVLTTAIGTFGVIAAQVATGLVVLAIGLWLANVAASAIRTSTIGNASTLATVARIAILFFAVPLALRQMGLPSEIVTIGFGSVMVALTIGAAIAIGVGGRHAAARIIDDVTHSLRANAVQQVSDQANSAGSNNPQT